MWQACLCGGMMGMNSFSLALSCHPSWRKLVSQKLPSSTSGVTVLLSSTCGVTVLRRPSRCLSGPSFDHLNQFSILGNPPNRSLIALEHLSFSNCWVEGRRYATLSLKTVFSEDKIDFARMALEELEGVKVDIFKPRGGIHKPNG